MLLIGSHAIKHHFQDFKRSPKDIDYIGDGKNIPGKVEYHENPIFDNYPFNVLQPNDILTLKASHIFWDIKWDKHIFDIVFLKSKGCTINKELFYKLYSYWNTIHSKNRRSDLKMSAKDFFDNAVKCEYDHDYLHTIINPTPTYTKVLIGEVEVGENKFNLLSHSEKCELVTEEVMVMAYERYKYLDYRAAYTRMLKKFIMNHAPMWEAIFIIENYIELFLPKFNFLKTIENGINRNQQTA